MVLNTDAHLPEDILTEDMRDTVLRGLTDSEEIKTAIIRNSEDIVTEIKAKYSK